SQFLIGEAVMVGEPLGDDQFGTKYRKLLLDALRTGDPTARADIFARENLQRPAIILIVQVLQVERAMSRLDDIGCAGEMPKLLDSLVISFPVAFREQDVSGAA